MNGFGPQVQHDPAILNIGTRHHGTLRIRVDQQIRRELVVDDPVVNRPDQIGLQGVHVR